MSEHLALPENCQAALTAIEADPLDLPEAVQTHLEHCPACAEARVHWLAQEEAPMTLTATPAGYFDRLPERILRKLPARRISPLKRHPALWLAAAALAMTIGIGGFLAGRARSTPMIEASLPSQPTTDNRELQPETLFSESEDPISQLSTLSPEEADAILKRLASAHTPHP